MHSACRAAGASRRKTAYLPTQNRDSKVSITGSESTLSSLWPDVPDRQHLSRDHILLLVSDFILRFIGIACFTIFIAGIYTVTGKASSIGFISLATVGPSLLVLLFAGTYTRFLSPLGAIRWFMSMRALVFLVAIPLADESVVLFIAAALQGLAHQSSVSAKMVLDAEYLNDANRVNFNAKKTMLKNMAVITAPALGGVCGRWRVPSLPNRPPPSLPVRSSAQGQRVRGALGDQLGTVGRRPGRAAQPRPSARRRLHQPGAAPATRHGRPMGSDVEP